METRRILLSKGMIAIVDRNDYLWLENMGSWYYHVGIKNKCGYAARKESNGNLILMHRMILGLDRHQSSDHINGDTLDNRRCNLRIATASQNMYNRRLNKNSTTGFKGGRSVCSGRKVSFLSVICRDRKHIRLGSFGNPEDAAMAYDDAAIRLFGEYARLNLIQPPTTPHTTPPPVS